MDKDKERQEISLLGRLLSLEALLVLMAALSLVSGILAADPVRTACGVAILAALIFLLARRAMKRRAAKSAHPESKERNPDARP